MKNELTEKEANIITEFANEGLDAMGGETATDLHEDNMSWTNANELADATGYSHQAVGGIMSSLEEKGLIMNADPGEEFGWVLTSAGIDAAAELEGAAK